MTSPAGFSRVAASTPGNPSSSPRAILFDLDGTLIATRRLYVEAFLLSVPPILGRVPSEEEMMALKPRSETRFLRQVVGDARAGECLDAFYRHYDELHEEHFQGVYTEVPQMLDAIWSLELPTGIVTGKSRRAFGITRRHLRHHPELNASALDVFQPTVCGDEMPHDKPHPGGLHMALEALQIAPDQAAYVGDSLTDVEAAVAAGVRPVAALWAKRAHEVEAFRTAALDHGATVVVRPSELAPALELSGG